MGFWTALRDVYPTTKEQRCWVHKMANITGAMPKPLHEKAKAGLQDIWMAETKKEATAAFDLFVETYGVKIGHTSMIPQELETGELAAIEEFATRSPASYYLATARSKRENHNLAAFRSWVIAGSKAMLKVSGGH